MHSPGWCGVLAVLALPLASVAVKWINPVAGPFRIIPGIIEDCPPELAPKKEYVRYNILARRDRRNQDVWYFSANLTSFITFDDNMTAMAKVASWRARGGWAEGANSFRFDHVCSFCKRVTPAYWSMAMVYVFNDPNRDCPFPPGNYSFTNITSNLNVKVPPTWFYGKYRNTMTLYHDTLKETVACLRTTYTIAPKVT